MLRHRSLGVVWASALRLPPLLSKEQASGSIRQSTRPYILARHVSHHTLSRTKAFGFAQRNPGRILWQCTNNQLGNNPYDGRLMTTGSSTSNLPIQPISSTNSATTSNANAVQKQVVDECTRLHSSIMDLNERLRGPLAPHSDRGTALPFVFLVGNHSSGKSSFINYVLGRSVQTAGVAPTDDSFTIIAPGPIDRDQDGPAVTGDPDLGFQSLQQFGPTLQHHTVLKIRSGIDSDFIMVDSPGMIDAPGNYSGMLNASSTDIMDRGYDFTGVVRWYADRADVVLLFFDPDKPGTTGETLSILLHALSGIDHKLLIILNKADQFEKIHDFARAYGSLCWNLSKVIPRKDLPRIYTMCLPVAENKFQSSASIPASLQDLHTARDEVVAEVRRAPARRVDNVISGLQEAVSKSRMHAILLQDLHCRWSKFCWQCRWTELGVATTGGSLTALLSMYGSGLGSEVVGAVVGISVLVTGVLHWYHGSQIVEWERHAIRPEELSVAFQRTHARAVQEGDEHVAALWQRIRDQLAAALQYNAGINSFAVSNAEIQQLDTILKNDIPRLRRQISPLHNGKSELY